MWKDYSIGFIKKNRASSVSVMVAAFISALFLSLLCGLFYNFWNYEMLSSGQVLLFFSKSSTVRFRSVCRVFSFRAFWASTWPP